MKDSPQDRALIESAQAGDSKAFEALLKLHYDRMYRFACKWCGNTTDAQDITQQACIKLARTLEQYRFESSFTTWLYRVVVTCAMDWYRSEGRHDHEDPEQILEPTRHNQNDNGVYLQQLLNKLESWGKGFKNTLLLVMGEGLTHAEAAKVLDVKESTISWRIHEIRKKLSLLEKEGAQI